MVGSKQIFIFIGCSIVVTPSCNIQERENLLGGERCQEPISVGEKGMGRLNEVGDGGGNRISYKVGHSGEKECNG